MGNNQATGYNITPEQYQHYLKLHADEQARIRQQYVNSQQQQRPAVQAQPQQQRPAVQVQQQQKRVMSQKPPLYPNQQPQFQQQMARSQIKMTNQQGAHQRIIPHMQPQVQNPETRYQDAYNQRMADNFNMSRQQQPINTTPLPPIPQIGHTQQPNYPPQQQPNYPPQQQHNYPQQQQHNYPPQQHFQFTQQNVPQPPKSNIMNEINEVQNLKYNPRQILGLTEDVRLDENVIKKAYRKLAVKYHPDKGGNEEIFNILTKAYLYLLKQIKGENYVEATFSDLKGNYANPQENGGYVSRDEDFNVRQFNQIFTQNRLDDIMADDGYGDWKTEDISDKPKKILTGKFSMDVFNRVFEEMGEEESAQEQQIQKYVEPQPLAVSNRLACSEVDYRRVADHGKEYDIQDGSSKEQLYYTDYKKAYTQTRLINPNQVKQRQEFRDIEEARAARENQDMTLTPEEEEYYAKKKQIEEAKEQERLERLRMRDQSLAEHSARVQMLLTGQSAKEIDYNPRQGR